jgi:hypothetical protein
VARNTVINGHPFRPSYFWFLARLWLLSDGAKGAINTCNHIFTHADTDTIVVMMKAGYLIRTSFDPAHPHNIKPSSIQRTWVSFTGSGVAYYLKLVERVNWRVRTDLMHGYSGIH